MAVDPFLDGIVVMLTGMHVPRGSAARLRVEVEVPHRELAQAFDDFASEIVQVARGVAGSSSGAWSSAYAGAMSTFVSGEGADALAQLRKGALDLADASHETGYQIDYTNRMIIAQVVQFLFEWAITLILAVFNPLQAVIEQAFLRALYRFILRSFLLRLLASVAMFEGMNVALGSVMDLFVRWSLARDGEHTGYGKEYASQSAGFGAVQGAFAVFVPWVGSALAGVLAKGLGRDVLGQIEGAVSHALSQGPGTGVGGGELAGGVSKGAGRDAGGEVEDSLGGGSWGGAGRQVVGGGVGDVFARGVAVQAVRLAQKFEMGEVDAGARSLFRRDVAGLFARGLGDAFGVDAAGRLGGQWADAFLKDFGSRRLGAALFESLRGVDSRALRSALSHSVADALATDWGRKFSGYAGDAVANAAHQNVSEGVYNVFTTGRFGTSWETGVSGAGAGMAGHVLHANAHLIGKSLREKLSLGDTFDRLASLSSGVNQGPVGGEGSGRTFHLSPGDGAYAGSLRAAGRAAGEGRDAGPQTLNGTGSARGGLDEAGLGLKPVGSAGFAVPDLSADGFARGTGAEDGSSESSSEFTGSDVSRLLGLPRVDALSDPGSLTAGVPGGLTHDSLAAASLVPGAGGGLGDPASGEGVAGDGPDTQDVLARLRALAAPPETVDAGGRPHPGQAVPAAGSGEDVPAAGLGEAVHGAGSGEDVPAAGLGEAVHGAGSGEDVPAAGLDQGVRGAGSGEAVHEAGLDQGVRGAGSGEAVHEAGLGEAVPGAGLGQDVHTTGSDQDVHEAGLGEGVRDVGALAGRLERLGVPDTVPGRHRVMDAPVVPDTPLVSPEVHVRQTVAGLEAVARQVDMPGAQRSGLARAVLDAASGGDWGGAARGIADFRDRILMRELRGRLEAFHTQVESGFEPLERLGLERAEWQETVDAVAQAQRIGDPGVLDDSLRAYTALIERHVPVDVLTGQDLPVFHDPALAALNRELVTGEGGRDTSDVLSDYLRWKPLSDMLRQQLQDTVEGHYSHQESVLRQRMLTAGSPQQAAAAGQALHDWQEARALQQRIDALRTQTSHPDHPDAPGDPDDAAGIEALQQRLTALHDSPADEEEAGLRRQVDEAASHEAQQDALTRLHDYREQRGMRQRLDRLRQDDSDSTPPPPTEEELRRRIEQLTADEEGPAADLRRQALHGTDQTTDEQTLAHRQELLHHAEEQRLAQVSALRQELHTLQEEHHRRQHAEQATQLENLHTPTHQPTAPDPHQPGSTQPGSDQPGASHPGGEHGSTSDPGALTHHPAPGPASIEERIEDLRRRLDQTLTPTERLADLHTELTTTLTRPESRGHLHRITQQALTEHDNQQNQNQNQHDQNQDQQDQDQRRDDILTSLTSLTPPTHQPDTRTHPDDAPPTRDTGEPTVTTVAPPQTTDDPPQPPDTPHHPADIQDNTPGQTPHDTPTPPHPDHTEHLTQQTTTTSTHTATTTDTTALLQHPPTHTRPTTPPHPTSLDEPHTTHHHNHNQPHTTDNDTHSEASSPSPTPMEMAAPKPPTSSGVSIESSPKPFRTAEPRAETGMGPAGTALPGDKAHDGHTPSAPGTDAPDHRPTGGPGLGTTSTSPDSDPRQQEFGPARDALSESSREPLLDGSELAREAGPLDEAQTGAVQQGVFSLAKAGHFSAARILVQRLGERAQRLTGGKAHADAVALHQWAERSVAALAELYQDPDVERELDLRAPPKVLNFYWAGRPMEAAAVQNLREWADRARGSGWAMQVWTDTAAGPGGRAVSTWDARVRADLVAKGVQFKEISEILPLKQPARTGVFGAFRSRQHSGEIADPGLAKLRDIYANARTEPKAQPVASDIARYAVLKVSGGVYADVDIAPGSVDLDQPPRLMGRDDIPMLAPMIRDSRELRRIRKQVAAELRTTPDRISPKQVGELLLARGEFTNSFIMVPPRSRFVDHLITEIPDHVREMPGRELAGNGAALTGPSTLAKAMASHVASYGLGAITNTEQGAVLDPAEVSRFVNLDWVTAESDNQAYEREPVVSPPTTFRLVSPKKAARSESAPDAVHGDGEEQRGRGVAESDLTEEMRRRLDRPNVLDAVVRVRDLEGLRYPDRSGWKPDTEVRVGGLNLSYGDRAALVMRVRGLDNDLADALHMRPDAIRPGQPRVLVQPGHATGDQFGIAAALIADPNLHVVVVAGLPIELRSPGLARSITGFYLASGVRPEQVHLVEAEGPQYNKLVQQEAEKIIGRELPGRLDKHREVLLQVYAGTRWVADNFTVGVRRAVRKAWRVDDAGFPPHVQRAVGSWLEARGVVPSKARDTLVLWSRFSGKTGKGHAEHDTSYEGVRQILRQVGAEARARGENPLVVIAGDAYADPSHAGKYGEIIAEARRNGLDAQNLTAFWKGDKAALRTWAGDDRVGQFKLYEYLHRNSRSARHLGFRSGNLEALALIGHTVRYMEEPGSLGGERMAQWHSLPQSALTSRGGLATGYERIMVSEPPTRTGKVMMRLREQAAGMSRAEVNQLPDFKRPPWLLHAIPYRQPKPAKYFNHVGKGFTEADLRQIIDYLLPARPDAVTGASDRGKPVHHGFGVLDSMHRRFGGASDPTGESASLMSRVVLRPAIGSHEDDQVSREAVPVSDETSVRTLAGRLVPDTWVRRYAVWEGQGDDARLVGVGSHTTSEQAERADRWPVVVSSTDYQDYDDTRMDFVGEVRVRPWGKDVSYWFGHGTPTQMEVAREDGTSDAVTGPEFGRALGRWLDLGPQERPVVLYACETGRPPVHGGLPVAQHVANVTGRVVHAPTTDTGTARDRAGRVRPTLYLDADGRPGAWSVFVPEPSGEHLDELARVAGLHQLPGRVSLRVGLRTRQLVRTLRGTFGVLMEKSAGYQDLLRGLAAVDTLRWNGVDGAPAGRYTDGRMTPDLLRRVTRDTLGLGTSAEPTPAQYRTVLATADTAHRADPGTPLTRLTVPQDTAPGGHTSEHTAAPADDTADGHTAAETAPAHGIVRQLAPAGGRPGLDVLHVPANGDSFFFSLLTGAARQHPGGLLTDTTVEGLRENAAVWFKTSPMRAEIDAMGVDPLQLLIGDLDTSTLRHVLGDVDLPSLSSTQQARVADAVARQVEADRAAGRTTDQEMVRARLTDQHHRESLRGWLRFELSLGGTEAERHWSRLLTASYPRWAADSAAPTLAEISGVSTSDLVERALRDVRLWNTPFFNHAVPAVAGYLGVNVVVAHDDAARDVPLLPTADRTLYVHYDGTDHYAAVAVQSSGHQQDTHEAPHQDATSPASPKRVTFADGDPGERALIRTQSHTARHWDDVTVDTAAQLPADVHRPTVTVVGESGTAQTHRGVDAAPDQTVTLSRGGSEFLPARPLARPASILRDPLEQAFGALRETGEERQGHEVADSDLTDRMRHRLDRPNVLDAMVRARNLQGLQYLRRSEWKASTKVRVGSLNLSYADRATLVMRVRGLDDDLADALRMRLDESRPGQPRVLVHQGYATGDQFGIAAALIADPNLHVVVVAGLPPERGKPGTARSIADFYLASGVKPGQVRLVEARGQRLEEVGQREAERVLGRKLHGDFGDHHRVLLPIREGTKWVAANYTVGVRRAVRKAWRVDDAGFPPHVQQAVGSWLEAQGVVGSRDQDTLVLWSRFSGKKGGAHAEHDTSYEGIRQILRQVGAEARARGENPLVVIAGDAYADPSHAGKYAKIVREARRSGLNVRDLTNFWKGDKTALQTWGGSDRIGQFKLYEYLHRNSRFTRHLGFRSGNLEALALIGHTVRYMEEQNKTPGGDRMAQWHSAARSLLTHWGGLAPGYERIMVSEPPTRTGKVMTRLREQAVAMAGAGLMRNRLPDFKQPQWLYSDPNRQPKPAKWFDRAEKGFTGADLRQITDYLLPPQARPAATISPTDVPGDSAPIDAAGVTPEPWATPAALDMPAYPSILGRSTTPAASRSAGPTRNDQSAVKDPFEADQASRRRIRSLSSTITSALAGQSRNQDRLVRMTEEVSRLRAELYGADLGPFLAGPAPDLQRGLARRENRLREIRHWLDGQAHDAQNYPDLVDEVAVLEDQSGKIRAELARRAAAVSQPAASGPADMRIARLLIEGRDTQQVLQMLAAESQALSNGGMNLGNGGPTAERRLIEESIARAREDQNIYRVLAGRRAVWQRVDQMSALRLILAERRVMHLWQQDMSAAHGRITTSPLLDRLYSLPRDETAAKPFLISLQRHLTERMSLVSTVPPGDAGGSPLLGLVASGPDTELGETVARAADARPVANPKGRPLNAALVSTRFQPTGGAVLPGTAVIHWKSNVRGRTIHTFTPEDRHTPTDPGHGATLTSLYPLLVHGDTDAVRLVLGEATGFNRDHELRQRFATGRPATDTRFPALIHGELSWRDVRTIVLTHAGAASERQAGRDKEDLERFARQHGLGLTVSLARLPGAPPAGFIPHQDLSRPVGTAFTDGTGRGALVIGRDFTPFADRETAGLGAIGTDEVATAQPQEKGYGIARSKAPWVASNRPAPFLVRAVSTADGIRVQLGNGTTTRLSPSQFADLLATDADVRRAAPGAPLVLVVPFGGERGLELPRLVAARTGREVWSAGGPLALMYSNTAGKWLMTRFMPTGLTPPLGPWVVSRPGDLALQAGTVETQTPEAGLLPTIDGSAVLVSDVVTHTIVGPTGRSIGRSSHTLFDQAVREPRLAGLYKLVHYYPGQVVAGKSIRTTQHPSEAPWAADIAAGRTPYFFNAHGTPEWVQLETAPGGSQQWGGSARQTVRVGGLALGGYLRRRPSLSQLPSATPVVLMACSTGDGMPGDSQVVAQRVADETGRVVYAPTGPSDVSGFVAAGRRGGTPDWRKFVPNSAGITVATAGTVNAANITAAANSGDVPVFYAAGDGAGPAMVGRPVRPVPIDSARGDARPSAFGEGGTPAVGQASWASRGGQDAATDPFEGDHARRQRLLKLSSEATTALNDSNLDAALRQERLVRAAQEMGRLRAELLETDLRAFLAGPESNLQKGLKRREKRLREVERWLGLRTVESQHYMHFTDERSALRDQVADINEQLKLRAEAGPEAQQVVAGASDSQIVRQLLDRKRPEKALEAMRTESSALSDLAKRLGGKRAAGRKAIEDALARSEEDQRLFQALAARPGVWTRVGEASAMHLVLAERRAQRWRQRDMHAAFARLATTPTLWRRYSSFGGEKSDALMASVHRHLAEGMSLVSTVAPGGRLFDLLERPDAQLGEMVAKAAGAPPVADAKERALHAELVSASYQRTGGAVRPGSVVIHWNAEVRGRTVHPFTSQEAHTATDAGPAATLSSLYPLLVHGDTDATRLALAEATLFETEDDMWLHVVTGRPVTGAHFPALIYGELGWHDVKAVVLTFTDTVSRRQVGLDKERLERFLRRNRLGVKVSLARLPGATPEEYVPQRDPSRPVGIALKNGTGSGGRIIGRDFTPFAVREIDGLGEGVTDEVAVLSEAEGSFVTTRSKAPWVSPRRPAAFVVRAVGAADGIRVQLGNGTTTRLSAAEFADLLAGDADVRRLTPGAPLVLVVPFGGAPGLLLPRLVAARTGREVWSAGGPLALSDTEIPDGKWRIYRYSLRNFKAMGPWVVSRPGDLALREGTAKTEAPSPGVLTALDGSVVLDSDVVTHTIVGPTGRSIGLSSHTMEDQRIRAIPQTGLYNRLTYSSGRNVEGTDGYVPATSHPLKVPWTADIAAGHTPYFFSAHGTPEWVQLETAPGGWQTSDGPVTRPVYVNGAVLGGFLRRRPSLAQMSPDTPIVLVSCSVGDGPAGGSRLVAQGVANESGRVVYAPDTATTDELLVSASAESDKIGTWRKFEPGARSAAKSGNAAGLFGRLRALRRGADQAAWPAVGNRAFVDSAGTADSLFNSAGNTATATGTVDDAPNITGILVGAAGRGVGAMGRGVDGPAFHAIVDAGGRIIGAAR
ncbi:hypothetical protein ABZ379_47735, partial [Streptomyces canus]